MLDANLSVVLIAMLEASLIAVVSAMLGNARSNFG